MNQHTHKPLLAQTVALELLREVGTLSKRFTGFADLADQSERAALSLHLNLAEGLGQPQGSGLKRKHYRIAYASGCELQAALDAALALGLCRGERGRSVRASAGRATALLGGLLRASGG